MDGTANIVPGTVTQVVEEAMRKQVSLPELRQRVWEWSKKEKPQWRHTTIEVDGAHMLISYFPSLADGLEQLRIPISAAYQSSLPVSGW